jgi:hypothetical protein
MFSFGHSRGRSGTLFLDPVTGQPVQTSQHGLFGR